MFAKTNISFRLRKKLDQQHIENIDNAFKAAIMQIDTMKTFTGKWVVNTEGNLNKR